jgi:hypothetical protein
MAAVDPVLGSCIRKQNSFAIVRCTLEKPARFGPVKHWGRAWLEIAERPSFD